MQMRTFIVGSVLTNCYVLWCDKTREAIVIDPGFNRQDEAEKVLDTIRENALSVKFIVNTHGHPDHICGNGIIKKAIDAPILIHELDAEMLTQEGRRRGMTFGIRVVSPVADSFLKDGDVIEFGKIALRVLHTPGHSLGSISLVGKRHVFTGDTLFAGSIGRVDLPGGSSRDIMHSLKEKLAVLLGDLTVCPGHGPKSTIEKEKRYNPFLQNFDASLL